MRFNPKAIWPLIKATFSAWSDDRAPSMGAALAYYTVFSLAPLLMIVTALAGVVFGPDAVRGQIVGELRNLVGADGAKAVEQMILHAWNPATSIWASIIGGVTLLLGATSAFVELQDDLDRIWDAKPLIGNGFVNFIKARFLSFGMILAIGFLLLVSLILSAALNALGNLWSGWFSDLSYLLEILNFVVSFSIITALFALIYKFLPHTPVAWEDVWIGAAVTSLLFVIGKTVIGLYLGSSSVTSVFGAAGAVVVLFVWFYYSSQIFLLGAEFTKVYAKHRIASSDQRQDIQKDRRAVPERRDSPTV